MPKYKVLLQQYVEMIAEVEIEADSPEDARNALLFDSCAAQWSEGGDAYSVSCYGVMDADGKMIWER